MSDILVQDRNDNLHMVDYCSPYGNKYTFCGLIYTRKDIINTLSLDMAIPDICRKCYEVFQEMYQGGLNEDPRIAKGKLQSNLVNDYLLMNDKNGEDTENRYGEVIDRRQSNKMNLYKRKVQRK